MEWSEIQRAMVIFAHPDDAEFGSAGTTAKLVNDGKAVFYVVCTDGSKGSDDPEMTPERLTEIRKAEQLDAARVLGVQDVAFLDFPDGMLQPTLDLRRAITAEIRRYRPDVVITQSPARDLSAGLFVQHPDHVAVGEATFAAVYPCARDRLTFPELAEAGLEPWAVKELWVSGTTAADYFVDITDSIERKIEALRAHASQVGEEVGARMKERARQVGEPREMGYAEGFRRIVIP